MKEDPTAAVDDSTVLRAEFQLTFEEYDEALTTVRIHASRREATAKRSGAQLIPWAIYTAVAIGMTTLASRFDSLAGSRPTYYTMIALMIPLAVSSIAALILSAYL